MPSDRVDEIRTRRLDASRSDIDPLRLAQEILEGTRERHRVSAQRNDSPALGRGPLNLLADMGRGDRLFGENQYDHLGFVDCPHDLVGVERTRDNISGRDPALQPRALERPDNGIGDGGVLRGIAYESIGSVGMSTRWFRRSRRGAHGLFTAAAFGHLDHTHCLVGVCR
jgi:hypothetical protein